MICDECGKNEATHHSIQKINGRKTETHLCRACFKKRGLGACMPLSDLSGIFSGMNSLFSQEDTGSLSVCRDCGAASEDFLSTGYVGCENCYSAFAPLILPRIQKMQHSIQHTGKRPPNVRPSRRAEADILKAQLKEAIDVEDYERADDINRQLKKLAEEGR
ncbi:MAG: hypothetical protein LBH24_02060 [Clostridiales bacterium]|jgi:protein arginine kinase activator|nr:hypothetical protein [Clostridiales bacterium]